jgi:methionyl-tRNA synthetase
MVRYFVGVAWPYANAPVTIGQAAGAFLPADIFARFHRLKGDEVLMVSGSDVHGTPILVTAEKEGSTPAEVARRYGDGNRRALEQLGISYDVFTDTHTLVHERTVQEIFLALLEKGYLRRRTEENPYCPKHQRFLPDRYVEGECPFCHSPTARGDECDNCGRILEAKQLIGPKCRLCGTPAEFRPSEHFYLLLDKIEPQLRAYLSDKTYWRPSVSGTTRNFLDEGLHATPITRDLEWGVPIPLEGYGSKRFYVWFEAVVGYLSASREWAIRAGRPEAWKKFWALDEQVQGYYFLGKDNIFFHTVVWPSMLLGVGGLQLPYDVPANEWLRISGGKISKSRPLDPELYLPALVGKYPADVIRLYAAALAPQNHDTDFSWEEFHQLTEDILSNQYGNLVQRVLVLVRERCAGKIPSPPAGWSAQSPDGLGARIREAHEVITAELSAVHLKEALDRALTEVRDANRRIHDGKPWQAPDADRDRTLYEAVWSLKAAAIWLAPYLPNSSRQVFRMLGYGDAPVRGDWDSALSPPEPGQAIGEVQPLFPRREEPRGGPSKAASPSAAPAAASLEIGPVPALDLRVGVVREAADHPSADKLYVLKVDVGEPSVRTVVAGVKPFYPVSELVGRRIVLLANLEPRTIRRITSQGMVLAADDGTRAHLLEPPPESPVGAPLAGAPVGSPVVSYAGFERTPMLVGRVGPSDEGHSEVDVGGRTVRVAGAWPSGSQVVVRITVTEPAEGEVLAAGPTAPVRAASGLPSGTRVR